MIFFDKYVVDLLNNTSNYGKKIGLILRGKSAMSFKLDTMKTLWQIQLPTSIILLLKITNNKSPKSYNISLSYIRLLEHHALSTMHRRNLRCFVLRIGSECETVSHSNKDSSWVTSWPHLHYYITQGTAIFRPERARRGLPEPKVAGHRIIRERLSTSVLHRPGPRAISSCTM